MFNSKNKTFYIFIVIILLITSVVGSKIKQRLSNNETQDEYALIKKYLLNESPLYKDNKPKLWIHTKYEYNSRLWKSFYSRSSYDLNQPYIHLCIRTIIHHCGNDFNIILIDDNAFNKLIPSWKINLNEVADPLKSRTRQIGLVELVYLYGGFVVPNTFICKRNLHSLYLNEITNKRPFVCEMENNNTLHKHRFIPSFVFFGSVKNNPIVKECLDFLKIQNENPHISLEPDITGVVSNMLMNKIRNNEINVVKAEWIGLKDKHNKPIQMEDLFEEEYLDLHSENYGIYVNDVLLLNRTKYNWFCVLPEDEILKQSIYISKYISLFNYIINSISFEILNFLFN